MNEITISKLAELKLNLDRIVETNLPVSEKWSYCKKFFYQFVDTISSEQIVAFSNFYAKCRYTLSKLDIDDIDRLNFDALRRFCKNDNFKTNIEGVNQFISLFNKILYRLNIIGESQFINLINNYFLQKFPIIQNDSEIKILCDTWSDLLEMGDNHYFILNGYDLNNLNGLLKVVVKDFQFTKLTYLHSLLNKGAIIRFENLSKDNNSGSYSTTITTILTFEPDFLIDATGIGECFQFSRQGTKANSKIYTFSRLMNDLPGEAALKGSFVGYYLDEMICGETNNEKIFEKAKRSYPIRSAQFGNERMNEIKKSINREHFTNLQTLVRNEKQPNSKIWIEPTYFSAEYGIQGRIDLLRLNENSSKDIVELKSGSPSNLTYSIAWPSHKYQVVNYDLLLNSTYGDNRQGSNSVFYSKCQISPYRNIVSESKEKQNSLFIRNRIVKGIYELSINDFSLLYNIKRNGITYLPRFNETALTHFQSIYGKNELATKYYNEMIAFVLRELINAKVGGLAEEDTERKKNGFASLWLDSVEDKKDDFSIIPQLKVSSIDSVTGYISLDFTEVIPHSFRKKDLVVLYPKSNGKFNALDQHILKGSIVEITSSKVTVSLYNKQTDYSFINQFNFWAIEPDIFERNYWSTISNLFNVLEANKRKFNLLLGTEEPQFKNSIEYSNPNLNKNQNKLIECALNAKDYFLLQGPPGTGKTSTFLVNYLREAIQNETNTIIILAFTNKAVDKICENLYKQRFGNSIDYVRLGSRNTEDEFFFNTLAEQSGSNPDNWRCIIESSKVIVSTVATFQNKCLLLKEFVTFNQLIIDEASQLTEADLSGVITQFNKFVLIGDQKQLPAVITQSEINCQVKDKSLYSCSITDLRISLFERLYSNAKNKGWDKCYGQLTTHYRMHETIANEISRHYDRELTIGQKKQNLPTPIYHISINGIQGNIGENRLVFIECKPEALPKKNTEEANVCASIVVQLLDIGYSTKEIGIITPFRAQITEIKKRLPSKIIDDENFIVDTVERFQGDERKIIIFSTTVANKSQLGSMQSIAPNDYEQKTDRKLLVSISRASEQFIILGNSEVLKVSKDYLILIDSIVRQNGYYKFNDRK